MSYARKRLGSVASAKSGFAFSRQQWREAGVPVVKIKNVRHGRVSLEGCGYVSEEVAAASERYRLNQGDVLVTMSGEIGSVGLFRERRRVLLNQRVGRFTILDPAKLHPRFLFYVMRHPELKREMEAIAYGVAQPNISPSLIENLSIPLPELSRQVSVASALAAYDELIENNLRRIEILGEMARAIYREWFVDFRFPGHEDVEVVESDLGPIPEGWSPVALGDLADVVKGLSYKGAYLAEDGVPMANLKCFASGGGFRRAGLKMYDGPFKDRHAAAAGDIVVANTDLTQAGNIIGSAALLPKSIFGKGGLLTHHLFRVRVIEDSAISSVYLLGALGDARFREWAKGHASGTTVLGFRRDDALRYPLILPPSNVTERFDESVAPLWQLAEVLEDQSQVVAETRDLLLPRLISGEIDVSELDIDTSWLAA